METRTETVASLLQDGFFDIPSYQRSYSWTEPQLADLLDDLIYLPEERMHFFGNLILDPQDEDFRTDRGRRFPKFDIVDGQQRLTTVMILLSVAAEKDNAVAETIEADNLLNPVQTRPRLLPQDQDKEFFRDGLLGDSAISPETPSQGRLQAAKEFYEKRLDNLPTNVSIQDITERLRYDCRVNVVELTSKSEAASIFESLNDRGKPLSSLDKTKSFLMYMDDRTSNYGMLQDQINDRFGSVYKELFVLSTGHEAVESFDEDAVQRFHWGLYDGYHSGEYFNALETLKSRLREHYRQGELDEVQHQIDEYTKGLREVADAFAELLHPAQRSRPVQTPLTRLLELGRLANVLPVLMAAQKRFGDEQPEKMAAIIDRCETFVFRLYVIGNYQSNTGRGKLVSLAHEIDADSDMSHQAMVNRLDSITRGYVDADRFRRDLSDPDFYSSVSSQDIRYLLHRYEKELNSAAGEDTNSDLATILSSDFEVEHILARNLEAEHIPADLQGEFEDHVDRLGNLTIASSYWNKKYGNLPFSEKKGGGGDKNEAYSSSTLRVQQSLAEYDVFDRAAIDEREQEIIEFAVDEWTTNPQPESASVPPLTLPAQFGLGTEYADADISVDQASQDTLVATFQQAPSAEWVTTALDIFRELIFELNLRNDNPSLVASFGSGDRIAISLNNRYVLYAGFSGTPSYGLLTDREITENENLTEQATRHSTFDSLPGEEGSATAYFLRFEQGHDQELTGSLREGWITGAATELDRASGSPYQRSHQPILYKAAVNPDFRKEMLDAVFDE